MITEEGILINEVDGIRLMATSRSILAVHKDGSVLDILLGEYRDKDGYLLWYTEDTGSTIVCPQIKTKFRL